MPTYFVRVDTDRLCSPEALSQALQHSTAAEALSEALCAEVRLELTNVISQIIEALYRNRDTGALTGEDTLASLSAADFVDAVSAILDENGLTPDGIR